MAILCRAMSIIININIFAVTISCWNPMPSASWGLSSFTTPTLVHMRCRSYGRRLKPMSESQIKDYIVGLPFRFYSQRHFRRRRYRNREPSATVLSDVSKCCSDIWRVSWSRWSDDTMCRSTARRRSAHNVKMLRRRKNRKYPATENAGAVNQSINQSSFVSDNKT